ncbi:MAG: class I SAM-dependent methyltransferase [Burkholderiales bacterium]|nr:class I SAM-dependent methyltransferase [Burkholderiales bacterium]
METANAERCPFCSSTRLNAFTRVAHDATPGGDGRVNVVECPGCVAAWQYPLGRNPDESRETFDAAYTAAEGGYFDPARRRAVSELQRQFIEARMPVGDVLDVGCGDGSFARTMAEAGWRATGLDPAVPDKVLNEPGPPGLQLIRGSLADLPDGQCFDLITLWDVVEHLDHPMGLLGAVTARLRPGGLLVMETGNYQSAGRIESGDTWWNYQLDHRWYFAPPQLEAIARDIGLEPVEWAPQVLRPWWRGSPTSHPPRLRSVVKALAKGPQAFVRAKQRHDELGTAHRDWPHWGGLEIVTLIAKRPA